MLIDTDKVRVLTDSGASNKCDPDEFFSEFERIMADLTKKTSERMPEDEMEQIVALHTLIIGTMDVIWTRAKNTREENNKLNEEIKILRETLLSITACQDRLSGRKPS